jgi:Ca2+-binding RTX toxin-like protein
MAEIISTADGEVLFGSDDGDTLTAEHSNVTLHGGGGSDFLVSITGTDGTVMDGGADGDLLVGAGINDTASYADDPVGVVVNLDTLSATDGSGGSDFLLGIENVAGSAFDDVITGDVLANMLQGGGGNDDLTGLGGGDTFKYSFTFTPGQTGGDTYRFTDYFESHGGVLDVAGEVADGTGQGQFSSLYTQWLEMLVKEHGLGTEVLDLGQNSGTDGTPVIENMTGEFGERESFTWTSGGGKKQVVHERWYSDTWSSPGEAGEDSVTNNGDGLDSITDFVVGEDLLQLDGLPEFTLDQFTAFFSVATADPNGDGIDDTVLSLNDGSWGVNLLSVSVSIDDLHGSTIFS